MKVRRSTEVLYRLQKAKYNHKKELIFIFLDKRDSDKNDKDKVVHKVRHLISFS